MTALVVGAGGLGCPLLVELARSVEGPVVVWDPDRVESTNLHRQFLFTESDVGRPKAEAAAHALARWVSASRIHGETRAFTEDAAAELREFDVVFDATDRLATKMALQSACRRVGVDYVFGSAVGWSGQAMFVAADRGPCLHCAFPRGAEASVHPTCETAGVFGPILGVVAAQQVQLWRCAERGLWSYDGRSDDAYVVEVVARPGCPGCRGGEATTDDQAGVAVAATWVDLRGRVCPDTYVETRRVLERLPVGGRLGVIFDSDEAAREVPLSAAAAGHRVVGCTRDGIVQRVVLERGA